MKIKLYYILLFIFISLAISQEGIIIRNIDAQYVKVQINKKQINQGYTDLSLTKGTNQDSLDVSIKSKTNPDSKIKRFEKDSKKSKLLTFPIPSKNDTYKFHLVNPDTKEVITKSFTANVYEINELHLNEVNSESFEFEIRDQNTPDLKYVIESDKEYTREGKTGKGFIPPSLGRFM